MPDDPRLLFFTFIKFGLVGFGGLLLDFGLTYLVKEKLHWNKYVANSLGFILACTSNYLLNRAWTFHSADPAIAIQFSKFLLVAITGLLLNNLVIYILTGKARLPFYVAKFVAVVLIFVWNFSLNYLYTFTR